MASVNMAILIGNLGADPEQRAFSNGDQVCNLRLATTEKWKDQATGDTKETTEWHRVVLYRRLAEVALAFLRKRSAVYIERRVRTRKWKDQAGKDRHTTEIEATEMKMLDRMPSPGLDYAPSVGLPPTKPAPDLDKIPF